MEKDPHGSSGETTTSVAVVQRNICTAVKSNSGKPHFNWCEICIISMCTVRVRDDVYTITVVGADDDPVKDCDRRLIVCILKVKITV